MIVTTGKLNTDYCKCVCGDIQLTHIATSVYIGIDKNVEPIYHVEVLDSYETDALVFYEDVE